MLKQQATSLQHYEAEDQPCCSAAGMLYSAGSLMDDRAHLNTLLHAMFPAMLSTDRVYTL